jgi:hypothetical protein
MWNFRCSLVAAVALTLGIGHATSALGARYIGIQIILDGKVILEGNASDDGSRDADQLWDALKSVRFKPTEEFQKLNIQRGAKEAVVRSTSPEGELVNLIVDVDVGGTAITNELHLKRVPADEYGREWQLNSQEVADLFDSRTISRREAAKLASPKRKP